MSVADAQRSGYGIGNTPTRLLLRSPMAAPETYIHNVSEMQSLSYALGMINSLKVSLNILQLMI